MYVLFLRFWGFTILQLTIYGQVIPCAALNDAGENLSITIIHQTATGNNPTVRNVSSIIIVEPIPAWHRRSFR